MNHSVQATRGLQEAFLGIVDEQLTMGKISTEMVGHPHGAFGVTCK